VNSYFNAIGTISREHALITVRERLEKPVRMIWSANGLQIKKSASKLVLSKQVLNVINQATTASGYQHHTRLAWINVKEKVSPNVLMILSACHIRIQRTSLHASLAACST
jgi:hypothetical protein